MIVFLEFLKAHWMGALTSASIALLLSTFSVQHLEIAHYRQQAMACKTQMLALSDANRALAAAAGRQNAAVAAWQARAESKSKEASKAVAASRETSKRYAGVAEQLLSRKTTGDECRDMRALINDFIGDPRVAGK